MTAACGAISSLRVDAVDKLLNSVSNLKASLLFSAFSRSIPTSTQWSVESLHFYLRPD